MVNNIIDLINSVLKYCTDYIDLSTKVARKEFNFGILIYSILFIDIRNISIIKS